MSTNIIRGWTSTIKRQAKHRFNQGIVCLTPEEARALVAIDAGLNGYEGFRRDRVLGQVTFTTERQLDYLDLIEAIRVGIDRNTVIDPADPLHDEKNSLRATQTALFGSLDKPIGIVVGTIYMEIKPQAVQ
ncbi:hypothetical protein RCH14_003798 [Massilia sp. MP_M2]|uniref:hypothetical protein n=1 Tax=Massilia sp. MP_M2 TaxID=3071713 RepID=UPI00319DDC5E